MFLAQKPQYSIIASSPVALAIRGLAATGSTFSGPNSCTVGDVEFSAVFHSPALIGHALYKKHLELRLRFLIGRIDYGLDCNASFRSGKFGLTHCGKSSSPRRRAGSRLIRRLCWSSTVAISWSLVLLLHPGSMKRMDFAHSAPNQTRSFTGSSSATGFVLNGLLLSAAILSGGQLL